jgi:Tol biopolymer transport system component
LDFVAERLLIIFEKQFMRSRNCALLLFVACALLSPRFVAQTMKDDFPRLPGAVLLTGHLPNLVITTPRETLELRESNDQAIGNPSMSLNGEVVAAIRFSDRVVISTYSVASKKWTDYRDMPEPGGGLAISPDGFRLAFAIREKVGAPFRLHLMDLKTKAETVGPDLGGYGDIRFSWSPDGRRIAFDMDVNRSPANTVPMIPTLRPAIHVLDLETGKISKIADGRAPAWSPSGEWIAYLNYSANKENPRLGSSLPNSNQACLMHPDGTGFKVLVTLPGDNLFTEAPVWSPDSKSILLNRVRDDLKSTIDIYVHDLSTLKVTKNFKDAPPVYGWAEAK